MQTFNNVYDRRPVLVTGHTGFKGSWLCVWLEKLGAKTIGFSNQQRTDPNHYELLKLPIVDLQGDICDLPQLQEVFKKYQPEIVFHLAAQALVRYSYKEPLETFSANTLGTASILQAACECDSVKAVVVITTDKVYENQEREQGYCETDRLGGHDPYAASKACAELVVNSFRQSFYAVKGKLLASCRAGNVIGGGDWAEDRLIPDLMRAAAKDEVTPIRMPYAVRPWEHVLEPLGGYLLLGQYLLEGKAEFAEAWNFGPEPEGHATVGEIIRLASQHWPKIQMEIFSHAIRHETTLLKLDCTKAKRRLNWKPVWNLQQTVEKTVRWYREFYEHGTILTREQLETYLADAEKLEKVTLLKKAG
ncbi:MAG: CDP-glucose 4,6-dehydratase [Planctomycetaceae bacterium]|nr:CDP-glucose 4,6-dehydratase [Planctomycetaceae bacterium]